MDPINPLLFVHKMVCEGLADSYEPQLVWIVNCGDRAAMDRRAEGWPMGRSSSEAGLEKGKRNGEAYQRVLVVEADWPVRAAS